MNSRIVMGLPLFHFNHCSSFIFNSNNFATKILFFTWINERQSIWCIWSRI